jgi:hypothetical protein
LKRPKRNPASAFSFCILTAVLAGLLALFVACGGGGDAPSAECRADADCERGFFCRSGVCLRWSSGFSDAAADAGPDAGDGG